MRKIVHVLIISSISLSSFARNMNDSFDSLDNYQRRRGLLKDEKVKQYRKSNVITVDTRNQEACHKIANQLSEQSILTNKQYDDFCLIDAEKPLISVMDFNEEGTSGVEQDGLSLKYSSLSSSDQKLATETRNFLVPAAALMTIFFLMPTEDTGWEKFSISEVIEKYNENVTKGPVIDTNQWAYNWIGHPYSGAAYYTVARHAGLSRGSSFAYSFWMSTLYWEYGVEAIAEIPSIQDLIVTPVLGSLLGEAFMQAEAKIKQNGGQVLGSNLLGSVSLVLVNPVGGLFDLIDDAFDNNAIKETEGYMRVKPGTTNTTLELGIKLHF